MGSHFIREKHLLVHRHLTQGDVGDRCVGPGRWTQIHSAKTPPKLGFTASAMPPALAYQPLALISSASS